MLMEKHTVILRRGTRLAAVARGDVRAARTGLTAALLRGPVATEPDTPRGIYETDIL